jgi:hypothetical protein
MERPGCADQNRQDSQHIGQHEKVNLFFVAMVLFPPKLRPREVGGDSGYAQEIAVTRNAVVW